MKACLSGDLEEVKRLLALTGEEKVLVQVFNFYLFIGSLLALWRVCQVPAFVFSFFLRSCVQVLFAPRFLYLSDVLVLDKIVASLAAMQTKEIRVQRASP